MLVSTWEGADDEWNAVVGGDGEGGVEHLAEWRRIIEKALGHRCHYLGARGHEGELQGVLPLVEVRSRLFGHYLVSMPFLNAGGALGPPAARTALTDAAVRLASTRGADLLELRSRGRPDEGLTISERKITHLLPLPSNADALWSALPSKVRNLIRKPMKAGLVGRVGADQRAAFYEVFARHMRDLGTPVLPARWFEAIAAGLPGHVVFAAVYDGERAVAGACGFVRGDRFEITWASARREWNHAAPNMLLYWTVLQAAIERGATTFDFGRCTPGSATHAFKRQWGGSDLPLTWGQWRARDVVATPASDRGVYRFASACWSRLPLAVTNRLGPLLAARIP